MSACNGLRVKGADQAVAPVDRRQTVPGCVRIVQTMRVNLLARATRPCCEGFGLPGQSASVQGMAFAVQVHKARPRPMADQTAHMAVSARADPEKGLFPPVECPAGTRPSQAALSRALWNWQPSPAAATRAGAFEAQSRERSTICGLPRLCGHWLRSWRSRL